MNNNRLIVLSILFSEFSECVKIAQFAPKEKNLAAALKACEKLMKAFLDIGNDNA